MRSQFVSKPILTPPPPFYRIPLPPASGLSVISSRIRIPGSAWNDQNKILVGAYEQGKTRASLWGSQDGGWGPGRMEGGVYLDCNIKMVRTRLHRSMFQQVLGAYE